MEEMSERERHDPMHAESQPRSISTSLTPAHTHLPINAHLMSTPLGRPRCLFAFHRRAPHAHIAAVETVPSFRRRDPPPHGGVRLVRDVLVEEILGGGGTEEMVGGGGG